MRFLYRIIYFKDTVSRTDYHEMSWPACSDIFAHSRSLLHTFSQDDHRMSKNPAWTNKHCDVSANHFLLAIILYDMVDRQKWASLGASASNVLWERFPKDNHFHQNSGHLYDQSQIWEKFHIKFRNDGNFLQTMQRRVASINIMEVVQATRGTSVSDQVTNQACREIAGAGLAGVQSPLLEPNQPLVTSLAKTLSFLPLGMLKGSSVLKESRTSNMRRESVSEGIRAIP